MKKYLSANAVFILLLLTGPASAQTQETFLYRACPDPNYKWTNYYESNRFVLRYSEDRSHDAYVTETAARAALANLENSYDSIVHKLGFSPAHVPTSTTKYKCEVIVTRGANNTSGVNAWADGGGTAYGGLTPDTNNVDINVQAPVMWVPAGLNHPVMTHELTHGLQQASGGFRNSDFVGWLHESHANFMAYQIHGTGLANTEVVTRQAHIHLGFSHTRYDNWPFLEYFKDTKGMQFINDMWAKSYGRSDANRHTADPFGELMRVHNMSQAEFGDLIGGFAMKNVIYDYANKAEFRSAYNASGVSERHRRHRFTYLEALDSTDGANGRFASPFAFAPQRYGFNIIRLYPDAATGSVTVRFRGNVQERNNITNYTKKLDWEPDAAYLHNNPGSDWRYGLVAVTGDATSTSANVTARYGDLKRAADGNPNISIDIRNGETQLYLVVAAAPTVNHKIKWDQYYYTIYRFPYMVEINGAKPEGFQEVTNPAGRQHANGGGFVSNTATVAATAYVGPNARVLGGTVSGNARIEGRAIVRGGNVSGGAVVKDYALIAGGTVTGSAIVSDGAVVWEGQISDNARIHGSSFVYGSGSRISENAQVGGSSWFSGGTLSGTAQMLGNGSGTLTASSGIFFAGGGSSADDKAAANRTSVPVEVTAPRSMAWYGDEATPVVKTQVIAKNTRTFKFDDRGNFRYNLGGAAHANLSIFDARGRLLKTVRLNGTENSVSLSRNMNTAAQMLLWKVEINGKIAERGRVGFRNVL